MKTALFDFHLPLELIAQEPLSGRDTSRLLVFDRMTHTWFDRHVTDLPELLCPGDLLVLNNTKVIPARLRAVRDKSGGKIEFLLLPPEPSSEKETGGGNSHSVCRRVLTRSRGRLDLGESFTLPDGLKASLRERRGVAGDLVEFHCTEEKFASFMGRHGEVPLPHYIHRPAGPSSEIDRERYQTVYARTPGAVAAPTAGLHFSEKLMKALSVRGILTAFVTLHVGPGTFRPVKSEEVEDHFMDPEPYTIPAETVTAVRAAKQEGRRVIAVGTTSLRTLEGSAVDWSSISADATNHCGQTNLFVYPPFQFKIVDALMTNFHVPKSSLLMLVSALAAPGTTDGINYVKAAYAHAIQDGYRFFSYGDSCLFI
jgi:S-adenosylmethionine:tRNA ribosyltransferase-isomerase